jgi:hypothetical protein
MNCRGLTSLFLQKLYWYSHNLCLDRVGMKDLSHDHMGIVRLAIIDEWD